MDKFTLEKFNPTVAELKELADKYSVLKISGIDDKEGYQIVKTAQLELRDKRTYITKTLKTYRQEAVDFQKAVLGQEKELLGIIDKVESGLKAERARIDEEIEVEKRKEMMPERRAILKEKGLDATDDQLLLFTDMEFDRFVMIEEQKKMDKEKEEMEKEKAKIQEEKDRLKRKQEDEKIRKEAADKATKETEDRLERETKLLKEKTDAAREKADFDEEQRLAKIEKDKKDKVKAIKKEKENKEREEKEKKDKEIADQKKIEYDKRYQKWLSDHSYSDTTHKILSEGNKMVMRKRVSEIIID